MTAVNSFLEESILLDEDLSNDYEPEEPDYAMYLGMKLPEDNDLLYLAKEGLKAPLPAGWKAHRSKEDEIFYLNEATGQKTWEHPCDDFYRKQYLQMKAQKSRTNGKREEQKQLIKFQMQQKLILNSNIQTSTRDAYHQSIIPAKKSDHLPASNLNYSTNVSNFCDHSILINHYNRGNDSTVIKGSPIFAGPDRTPSPLGDKKSGSNFKFFSCEGENKLLPSGGQDIDELCSLSKCEFDDSKDLDGEDELEKLNAGCSEFDHDDLEDHIPSKDENKTFPEGFVSENDEESLNLSEFNLEFDSKSRREPSRAECYTNRGPKSQRSQRQQPIDSQRQIEAQEHKLQKELEVIDKEYEDRLVTLNQCLIKKLEEFQKEKKDVFESEKLRMNHNFQDELERIKNEMNEDNGAPKDTNDERERIELELDSQFRKVSENSKQQIEQEHRRKEKALELSVKEMFQIELNEQEKAASGANLEEKQEIQTEIKKVQQKLRDLLAEQNSQAERLTKLAQEHENHKINIELEMNKKLKDFDQNTALKQKEVHCCYKEDLYQELEYQRALASGEIRQFEEEIRLLQKDIQNKFLEDFEYDKQKMRRDLETDIQRYWNIEHGKIDEQFSARNDIDKNNEIRRKINAVEVEQLVYQQTLKRKLEEARFQMKKDLNSQIESINEQGAVKEQQLVKVIEKFGYQIEEGRQMPRLIQDIQTQLSNIKHDLLQKEETEADLLEEIQELTNKISESEFQLTMLSEKTCSSKQTDCRAAKKREILSSIDNLQKTIEARDKAILYVKQRSLIIDANESLNNPNQSISFILKEIETIKHTLETQSRQFPVPSKRPITRENIHSRTFLLNHTIDYAQDHHHTRFTSIGCHEGNRSMQKEIQDCKDEDDESCEVRENAPRKTKYTEKIKRDVSYEMIKSKSVYENNSAHNRSLHQRSVDESLKIDNKMIKKPVPSTLQSNIKLWRDIISQEREKLDIVDSEIKERKGQIKRMQDDIREEQERYKIENATCKQHPMKFHSKKASLEVFKRGLNENIKKYNDDLSKLREYEKNFKEKKFLLSNIKDAVDMFEKNSCWNDLELQNYFSRYKELKLNVRFQDETKPKNPNPSNAIVYRDMENKENREANLIPEKQEAVSREILKAPSEILQPKAGHGERVASNRESTKPNASFDFKTSQPIESNNSQSTNLLKKPSPSVDCKRGILLNQQENFNQEPLKTSNPQLSLIKAQIEIQKNLQNRLYNNLLNNRSNKQ